ncbi:hypothetical protein EAF00_006966 [Botryotinia globosa]|nr:hypothetical protein EAF00_006966 [Botryotinia globosa]
MVSWLATELGGGWYLGKNCSLHSTAPGGQRFGGPYVFSYGDGWLVMHTNEQKTVKMNNIKK